MLFGDKSKAAFEVTIVEMVEGWIFGTFILWINNSSIGDKEDQSVDLKGCINWLRDLTQNPVNRFDEWLCTLPKNEVWEYVVTQTMQWPQSKSSLIPDAFTRFHVTHVGMSSFDNYTVVLIRGPGKDRCLWQLKNEELHDEHIDQLAIEKSAKHLIDWFDGR